MAQRVVDEDLPDSAAGREAHDRDPHGRVASDEGDGGIEFVGRVGGQADFGCDGVGGEEGGKKHVRRREEGGKNVLGDHHLRAGIGAVSGKNVVLGAICEAIEEKINAQQEEAPQRRRARGRFFGGRGGVVEGEDGDAGGNERNDEVFVERVAFAEDGQMQEHDGEKLAGFGEDEGDVVNVSERGISERGS